jgi:hypothetical protein
MTSTQSLAWKRRTSSRPIRDTVRVALAPAAIVSTVESMEAFSRDHLNFAVVMSPGV